MTKKKTKKKVVRKSKSTKKATKKSSRKSETWGSKKKKIGKVVKTTVGLGLAYGVLGMAEGQAKKK